MEKKPKGKYQDIINLPHHVSKTHPQMLLYDRAAQFSPFAALTGYEDAIRETARLTDNWVQLSEDKKQELDEKLRQLIDDCSQKIFLTDGTKIDLGRIVDIK